MKPITNIPIAKLHAFEGHPYKVLDNEEMNALIDSIQENGILTPLIVRPLEGTTDEYEVISGHRRLHAAQKAGLETVPAFIHAISFSFYKQKSETACLLYKNQQNRSTDSYYPCLL